MEHFYQNISTSSYNDRNSGHDSGLIFATCSMLNLPFWSFWLI